MARRNRAAVTYLNPAPLAERFVVGTGKPYGVRLVEPKRKKRAPTNGVSNGHGHTEGNGSE